MIERNEAVLLLSHCGYSFMEDLVATLEKMGLESYVLSSRPILNSEERIKQLALLTPNLNVIDNTALTWMAVKVEINKLRKDGIKIIACVTVWEGYRFLMSLANKMLGANDVCEPEVHMLRDKYMLRKKLINKGITNVSVEILDQSNFEKFKKINQQFFIKPRFGIASYGAFLLKDQDTWVKIKSIKDDFRHDIEYQSIFSGGFDFIIENYIHGIEYSFEIIALEGKPYIIGIHEKMDLKENNLTVLESACVSPPINLSRAEIENSTSWIEKIFQTFSIQDGCYHLEAKYDGNNWEIIEINPRVGGAFITKSIEMLTNGNNMLGNYDIFITFKEIIFLC